MLATGWTMTGLRSAITGEAASWQELLLVGILAPAAL